jgi:hypothetical protein
MSIISYIEYIWVLLYIYEYIYEYYFASMATSLLFQRTDDKLQRNRRFI